MFLAVEKVGVATKEQPTEPVAGHKRSYAGRADDSKGYSGYS